MLSRALVALAIAVAVPAAADQIVTRELTQAVVDLTFEDVDGAPTLPSSLTYRVVNTDSGLELLAAITIDPPDEPCPGNPSGCVRLTIPAEKMLIVGLCDGAWTRPISCRTTEDCPSFAPCRASTRAFQDHSLVLQWPDAHNEVTLHTLNLPHVYAPTLTPSHTPTSTPTATATATATASPSATPTTP